MIDIIFSVYSSTYNLVSNNVISKSTSIPLFKNTQIKFTLKSIGNQIYLCHTSNTWQYLYSESELINHYTGERLGYQYKNYWSFNILTTINQSSTLLMSSTRVNTKEQDINNIFYIKSSNFIGGEVPLSKCTSSSTNSSVVYIHVPFSCDYSFYEPKKEEEDSNGHRHISNSIEIMTKFGILIYLCT